MMRNTKQIIFIALYSLLSTFSLFSQYKMEYIAGDVIIQVDKSFDNIDLIIKKMLYIKE